MEPQGGGNVIRVFGGFNHIKDSSWSVLVYIKEERTMKKILAKGLEVESASCRE